MQTELKMHPSIIISIITENHTFNVDLRVFKNPKQELADIQTETDIGHIPTKNRQNKENCHSNQKIISMLLIIVLKINVTIILEKIRIIENRQKKEQILKNW